MKCIVIVVPLALLIACGGRGDRDPQAMNPSKASTSTQNAQVPAENSKALNPLSPASKESHGNRPTVALQTVIVDLTEYAINMPDTLKAGQHQLQVTNHGKEMHGLVIEGDGFHQQVVTDLMRGDSVTVEVNLAAGSYNVYCPVDGHKGKGMTRTLTVQ